jgi:cytochrome P450
MTDKKRSLEAKVPTQTLAFQAFTDMAAPQPVYRALIEAGGSACPIEGVVQVYSRELNDHVLRHHELFSSQVVMRLGNVRPLIPLNVDPPLHAKYRKILDPLFAPKVMDGMEDDITDRINHFIDAFEDRGECNFSEELADLFPSSVFLGLLGMPWSELDNVLGMRNGILHPEKIDPDARFDVDKRATVNNATGARIYDYFNEWLDERAARPEDDILTRALQAQIDGDKLTREEILDICFLFLIAGLDTVSDSLTCFWAFLARNEDHRRQIVENPSIIPNAVEELLRWESPVPVGSPRIATADTVLPDGREVKAGCPVMVSYGAANVDPGEFGDSAVVRFDRSPNSHIAFGRGVHRCLGSHLARRELRIALREWHRRIPEYRIKPGHEQLEYPPGLRHVKDLMLVWP